MEVVVEASSRFFVEVEGNLLVLVVVGVHPLVLEHKLVRHTFLNMMVPRT